MDTASTVATAPSRESARRPGSSRSPLRIRNPPETAIACPTAAKTDTPTTSTKVRHTTLLSTEPHRCNSPGISHIPKAAPDRNPTNDITLTTKPWR